MCCFLHLEAALSSRVLTWEAAALLGSHPAAHTLLSTCLDAREDAASYQASQLRGHRAFQKLHSLCRHKYSEHKQPVSELKRSNVRSSCHCVAEDIPSTRLKEMRKGA